MQIPKYPIDFVDCERGKRVTEEELNDKINNEVSTMITHMLEHNTINYSKSFEDVLIIIDRIHEDDQTYYEISISKEHSRGIVKLN